MICDGFARPRKLILTSCALVVSPMLQRSLQRPAVVTGQICVDCRWETDRGGDGRFGARMRVDGQFMREAGLTGLRRVRLRPREIVYSLQR